MMSGKQRLKWLVVAIWLVAWFAIAGPTRYESPGFDSHGYMYLVPDGIEQFLVFGVLPLAIWWVVAGYRKDRAEQAAKSSGPNTVNDPLPSQPPEPSYRTGLYGWLQLRRWDYLFIATILILLLAVLALGWGLDQITDRVFKLEQPRIDTSSFPRSTHPSRNSSSTPPGG